MMGLSLDGRVAVLETEMNTVQDVVKHAAARVDQILFAVLGILGTMVVGLVLAVVSGV